MDERVLLAKSLRDSTVPPRFEETLWGHTAKVIESFEVMFGSPATSPTRLAKRWLAFFGLVEADTNAFLVNARVACGVHDPGKGTNCFQDMLRGKRANQVIRHEHLSGLFLWLPEVAGWLNSIPLMNRCVIFSAVAGHHLRCKRDEFAQPRDPDVKAFRLFPEGLCDLFRNVGNAVGTPFAPQGEAFIEDLWNFDGRGGFNLTKLREEIVDDLGRFHRREIKKNPTLSRLVMAVRAALILADSSGSGIVRENKDLRHWLEVAFGEDLSSEYIEHSVIGPRVRDIEQTRGGFRWSGFQAAAEDLGKRALLLAPCGSGKTLAAWRWIKARLRERSARRVIFLYPTRATATEGFRDYVSWAPEADASLLHGTAAYELDGMFSSADDERSGRDFSTEDRLYALGYWQRRVFSATVDQFLGFMQQVYRSACLLPLLAESVVVVDEVHSFDRSLFSALKLFLKNFDVPVLCMTASLPPVRRQELVDECGLDVFPRTLEAFSDLQAGATLPRYNVNLLENEEGAVRVALEAMEEGKRALWVVNKVARCQRLARTLGALCYHSRFTLGDRSNRHRDVIEAFKKCDGAVVAITTQVCEMSLDLDANILICETAPITAMIQRMGRCNRHAVPGSGKLGEVFFYRAEDDLPYSKDDLAGSTEFVNAVTGQTVSQADLGELLERLAPNAFEPERFAAFLQDGPWAASREAGLRDDNDFSVTAILSDDIPRYLEMKKHRQATDGLYIPVPRRLARQRSRLGPFPQIAESSHYDPMFGFFDHPLEVIL
ncbi:MAG: CRISPR-associated helicase Cas3' [Syntrophobacteraceae bacterium]|jgi:CRISPR-associated endonuclease/helicase Cas3